MRVIFWFCLCLFSVGTAWGQNMYTLSGKVVNNNNEALGRATVKVITTGQSLMTDDDGQYSIRLKPGRYSITYSHVLATAATITIDVNADTYKVITLATRGSRQIEGVEVHGKTRNQVVKEQPIKAQVVDTKAAQGKSATLVELMNRSAGIRIRQSGGLGSNTDIMLNGFRGNSIKTFKDGVPTDYLGAAFNFATVPVNMLERVEVYKGVLPAELGADALGGAVNMVSRTDGANYLALSYEIGSFGTHRVSANYQGSNLKSGLFYGVNAFYNYAKNNYNVIAGIANDQTANVVPTEVELFHNAFNQIYGEAFVGIKNRSWADELKLALTGFYIKRDNQFAAVMERPFGAVYSKQYVPVIPTLHYKKKVMDGKLGFDQFLVYSSIQSQLIDTLAGSYDWYGQFHPPVNAGQIGERGNPAFQKLRFNNFTSRSNVSYAFNPDHVLSLNAVHNRFSRTGSDPYGATSAGANPVDMLSLPADYNKTVATAALTSNFLNGKLHNVLQAKYYHAYTIGREMDVRTGLLKDVESSATISTAGAGDAIKYNFTPGTFVRLSGEMATRLPEQQELLGDGGFGLANFNLKPEKSVNGNVGFGTAKQGIYEVEVNGFYRITKDMILNAPVNFLYSQNQNVEQVRGIGLEADAHVHPLAWLNLGGNFTYQDFRLYDIKTDPTIKYLEGARLRNMPYFFANLTADFNFNNTIRKHDMLHAYWHMGYVHEYYLNYIPKDSEPSGFLGLWGEKRINAPLIIPSQTVHTVGVMWSPEHNGNFTINLECKNIFDKPVYDNFRIQNMGRNFHVKLNYILKNKF